MPKDEIKKKQLKNNKKKIKKNHKVLKRVLLVATGALLSTTSVNQHQTIPAIAHAISLEANIWYI